MRCDVLTARVVHMQCGQHSRVRITRDLPYPVKFFNVVGQACGGYVVKLQGLSTYPRQARQSQAWVTGEPGKARLSTPSWCGQASYPCGELGGAFAPRRPLVRRGANKGSGPLIGLLRLRHRRASGVHDGSAEKQGFSEELACVQRATGQSLSFPSLHTDAVSGVRDGSAEKQGFSEELAGMQRGVDDYAFLLRLRAAAPYARLLSLVLFVVYFFAALLYPKPLLLGVSFLFLCLSVVASLTLSIFGGAHDT